MRSLADRVRRTILKHRLVEPGGRVLAAVSGGSDSVAMVHLLKALDADGTLTLVGLAHFNHRLRDEADGDEVFCREIAASLDLPIDVESTDVAALASGRGVSIEVAGRDARYAFLDRAADRAAAHAIAVGHTLDDQAETFLLRLLRGAGPRGLAAIRPRAGQVIRPLIELRRDELREYLAARGLAYCEDESNLNLDNPRNRLRHEVLPYLAAHFSPDVAAVLAREAAIARDDSAWLEAQAIEIEPTIVLSGDDALTLDLSGLRLLHPALARRVVQRALAEGAGGGRLGGRRRGRPPPAAGAGRATEEPAAPVPLDVPGRVELPALGWTLAAEPLDPRGVQDHSELEAGALAVIVAVDREVTDSGGGSESPLAVRTRLPGDRVRLPGGTGHRKLQDLFVDRKVPRDERDRVPLVVDRQGRIAWVVGHAVSGEFRVTAASRAVILLKASRLGGQG